MATKKENSTKESVIINSVDRSLDVLEYLFRADGDVSISQISKDLDIYKSTVFRTLATLENRGYVIQDPKTEMYTIGPKLFAFSSKKKANILGTSIRPYLKILNDKYHELVSLSVITRDGSGLYALENIDSIQSKHNLTVKFVGAAQSECYCASMGKCLLAFDDTVDITVYKDADLIGFTDNTITTYEGLVEEIEKVRRQGYAFDDQEREIGLFCLGVPIMSGDRAIAAMSLSGPVSRMNDGTLDEKIEFMKALSKEISAKVLL